MESGDRYALTASLETVAEAINVGRGKGELISLELDRIPTGQMVHIDPDRVESAVSASRW